VNEGDDGWDELIEAVDDAYAEEWAAELGYEPFDPDRLREIEWDWYADLGKLARERDEYRESKRGSGS
jgi:hypothetical protein